MKCDPSVLTIRHRFPYPSSQRWQVWASSINQDHPLLDTVVVLGLASFDAFELTVAGVSIDAFISAGGAQVGKKCDFKSGRRDIRGYSNSILHSAQIQAQARPVIARMKIIKRKCEVP